MQQEVRSIDSLLEVALESALRIALLCENGIGDRQVIVEPEVGLNKPIDIGEPMEGVDAPEEGPLWAVQRLVEEVGLRRDHRYVEDLVRNVDTCTVRVNDLHVLVKQVLA